MSSLVLAEEQSRRKTWVDWSSQGAWLCAALFVAPVLVGHGFQAQAVLLVVVAISSVLWIEYASRQNSRGKVWAIFAGIMGVLALLSALWDRHMRQD